jgi:Fe-S-cluster-containing dehydrogenase component/anaerobic selenocysteine-containing dehydrogenase
MTSDDDNGLTRRAFVQLLGASATFAGAGCVQRPSEKILPYHQQPENVIPGKPLHYATSMVLDGYATGLLVTSHGGRPTKIEGNPEHPASLGAAGVFHQASILDLYDPARARQLREGKAPRAWDQFARAFGFGQERADAGAGLRLLLEPTTSPLTASLLARVMARYPNARVTFTSPTAGNAARGAQLAWGRPLTALYDFGKARVVVSLGADFMARGPFHLRYARQLADRRRPGLDMLRFYQAETAPTPTGSLADHRLRARPTDMSRLAAALLDPAFPVDSPHEAWIHAARADLEAAQGASIVIAGDEQPPAIHAACAAVNARLQNVGQTVTLIESSVATLGEREQPLPALVEDMRAGRVETLFVLDANPIWDAPVELDLPAAFEKVATAVCLASWEHETARHSRWFVPLAHFLESWGDARALDGTVSLQQPLIAPMNGGRTVADVLSVLAGDGRGVHDLLVAYWAARLPVNHDFFWERALQRGFVEGSASPPVLAPIVWDGQLAHERPAAKGIELSFPPSPQVHDGRFAGNDWLLELPHPTTKLTWDNALLLSPATAREHDLASGDTVEVDREGRKLVAPVLVMPGHADGCGTLELGWGRDRKGVNAYPLRTVATAPALLRRLARKHPLAVTQEHARAGDRQLVALRALADAGERIEHFEPLPTLLADRNGSGNQWAMSIDTNVCNGCSGCVVACQAENNVPVVGKERVLRNREMHWLRIDRYLEGRGGSPGSAGRGVEDPLFDDDPGVVNQPMLCQHCEKAPCEYVCPVNATVHSADGLSEMVYNRCIGTRTCSNNCPYKVRRFNWFDLVDDGLVRLQRNPNVTVRERGVMEKCSFCVQRIRAVEIQARVDGREIQPGEVKTACQQACPTQAIRFGSLAHEGTEMMTLRADPRAYEALRELGTVPRIRYLAKVVNAREEG